MIRINQLKLNIAHTQSDLELKDFENASYEKRISSGIQDQTPVH